MPFQCNQNVSIRTTMLKRCSCSVHIGWAAILCTVHLEEKHARNLVSGLPSEAQVRCLLSLSFTSTKPLLWFPQISSIWAAPPFSFFQILLILFHLWGKVGSLPVLEDPDQRLRVIRNWFSVSWFTSIGCPYRCWSNCNYQREPTLTHFPSKKGILLFGGILMQWLHTANESYPLYQSTTSALSLLLLLLFYVFNYIQLFIAKCESRILALSSRCNVCVSFGHTSWRFPFLCSRFPSFSFCVVGCAPRSTPPSAYFLTFTHLLSLFIAFSSSLSSVFASFPSFLLLFFFLSYYFFVKRAQSSSRYFSSLFLEIFSSSKNYFLSISGLD